MGHVKSIDPDASLWEWLAFDLRRYRQAHAMTLEAAGKIVGCSRHAFANYEAGTRHPDRTQLGALDDRWGTGGHFVRLWTYANRGHDPDWFRAYLGYEAKADSIRAFEALWVPGLLQTEDYARASLIVGGVRDLEAAVAARMARQAVFDRSKAPTMWVLIDEGVIDRPVGGPEVMRAQLAHLLDMSQHPNVGLRILPRAMGAHVGLDGSFEIITTNRVDRVYIDAAGGGRLIDSGPEAERFRLRFDLLGSDALDRRSSRRLITRAMESMR